MESIEYLKKKFAVPTLCGCGCGNPLEKEGPHGPLYKEIRGKRVRVNTECYFDDTSALSNDAEEFVVNGTVACESVD